MMNQGASHQAGIRGLIDTPVRLLVLLVSASPLLLDVAPVRLLNGYLTLHCSVRDGVLVFASLFAWKLCFEAFGWSKSRHWSTLRRLLIAAAACLAMTVPWLAFAMAAHLRRPLRGAVLFFFLSLTYESGWIMVCRWIHRARARRDPQRILIVGSGRRASKAWRAIRTSPSGESILLGFVDQRPTSEMAPDIAARYLGTVDELRGFLLREIVDTIVIAMPAKTCYTLMQQAVDIAEEAGVGVVYLNDIFHTSDRQRAAVEESLFHPLIPLREGRVLQQRLKRSIDIVGAIIGLCVAAPLLVLIAIAIKATSRGSVFFRQERFGLRRRRFTMLKFRSMVENAPAMLAALEAENEASGPIFKMRLDPRVTPLGRLLRVSSCDELPQLWNVLKGDMSLVGPRPMSVRDVALFDDATLMRRFSVKPGLTGLWQISGRSSVNFDHWIACDFTYIDRWSLALDFKILMRTFSVVMRRSGAM